MCSIIRNNFYFPFNYDKARAYDFSNVGVCEKKIERERDTHTSYR